MSLNNDDIYQLVVPDIGFGWNQPQVQIRWPGFRSTLRNILIAVWLTFLGIFSRQITCWALIRCHFLLDKYWFDGLLCCSRACVSVHRCVHLSYRDNTSRIRLQHMLLPLTLDSNQFYEINFQSFSWNFPLSTRIDNASCDCLIRIQTCTLGWSPVGVEWKPGSFRSFSEQSPNDKW